MPKIKPKLNQQEGCVNACRTIHSLQGGACAEPYLGDTEGADSSLIAFEIISCVACVAESEEVTVLGRLSCSCRLTAEVDFEQTLFAGHRRHDESFLQFLSRKQLEFTRYEATLTLCGELPSHLRGKLLLRQAHLSTAQSQRILQWLAGSREEIVVRQALSKLDTDVDLTNVMTGQIAAPKSLWEAEADSSVKEEYAES
eukprot:6492779-Amphidinium_carterae.6